MTRAARWAAIVVTVFSAVSALGGGIAILVTDGIGMPMSMLENSPFTSFLLPGLILLIVIGGTQTAAAALLILRRDSGLLWAAVAGFAMLIWILIETVMIQGFGFLQGLYFGAGLVELILVFSLLGIVPWMPRVRLDETRAAPGVDR